MGDSSINLQQLLDPKGQVPGTTRVGTVRTEIVWKRKNEVNIEICEISRADCVSYVETEAPFSSPSSQVSIIPTSQVSIIPTSQVSIIPTSQVSIIPTSQVSIIPTSQVSIIPILPAEAHLEPALAVAQAHLSPPINCLHSI
ncbi:hypothetical protein STEG23_013942, partial [Scotinomys teguina]